MGRPENFFIHDGYQHRSEVPHFDDTPNSDEWQREVYQFAREVCDQERCRRVCDIGCGSAYKLLKYFWDFETVGVDVPATCTWLKRRYPDRTWVESDFSKSLPWTADLVIASDVIEHLRDPTALLDYISLLRPRYFVLSTPDRNLLRSGTHNGPPYNPYHVREWNMSELHAYVASRFQVHEHFIACPADSTQCVLGSPIVRQPDLGEPLRVMAGSDFRNLLKNVPIFADLLQWLWYRWEGLNGATQERIRTRISGGALRRPDASMEPMLPDLETVAIQTSEGRFSIEKARRVLGYSPRVRFSEGMPLVAKWLRFANVIEGRDAAPTPDAEGKYSQRER